MADDDQQTDDSSDISESAAFKAALQKAIDKEVAGLKETNRELKDEKRRAVEERESLHSKLGGDDGIQRLLNLQKQVENDEILQLIADGKGQEAVVRTFM